MPWRNNLNGANSYIVKPVNFDDFIDVVTKLGFYWLLVNKVPPTWPSDSGA